MTTLGPSSLDLLATQGIIPFDAQAYVTGEPSAYLKQCGIHTPKNPNLSLSPNLIKQSDVDSYNSASQKQTTEDKTSKFRNLKRLGAIALAICIPVAIYLKIKKTPITLGKNICDWATNVAKKITSIKKS